MNRAEKSTAGILGLLLVMCFGIVILGGYVRLSGSGLSIPEWPFFTTEITVQPDGSRVEKKALFPPSETAEWEQLRETFVTKYPEHEGLALSGFQRMFWIEWSHRGVAKAIGVVYLALLGVVFFNRDLRRRFGWLAGGGFALLVFQAVLGAIVVFFHLEATKVAFHLVAAFLFTCLILWMLMSLLHPPVAREERPGRNPMLIWSIAAFVIVLLQIFSGGLMAGSMAGYQMNTWPLMGDHLVPPNMWMENWGLVRNMVENKIVIQFVHRWFAFVALLGVFFLVARSLTMRVTSTSRWALRAMFAVTVLQIIVGIFTLLKGVHTHLALTHQSIGLLLLLNILIVIYESAAQPVLSEDALTETDAEESRRPKEATA